MPGRARSSCAANRIPVERKALSFHCLRLLFATALISQACGVPRYSLEGVVVPEATRIAILDSTASRKISQIHDLYTRSADSLRRTFADSLAALDNRLAGQAKPIVRAEKRLKSAQNNYAVVFRGMSAFTSFGGNPIFDSSDRKVRTKELLEEISDRFYRGKAFSLETGGQIRRMIRTKLVPAERRVSHSRSILSRLKKDRKAQQAIRSNVADQVEAATAQLVDQYNRRVVDRLEGAVIREATINPAGSFVFDRVPAGRYHLYTPSSKPKLVEVVVSRHTRVRVLSEDVSPLLQPTT